MTPTDCKSTLLFDSFRSPDLGPVKNRAAMSAMTRGFAVNHCATSEMVEYYRRRAEGGAGLILTEGVVIHRTADGYNDVPHIETTQQAESWRPVIEAVHAAGAKIYCQLWHCGRISHSDYTGGVSPVSSTSIAAEGINRQNGKPFGAPKALDLAGIKEVFEQYKVAASNALEVGFDGVQLHLGHGYLADQFFDARINDRRDDYGGSVENRCRFALELVEYVLRFIPSSCIGVRISPSRDMGGIYDWPDLSEMLSCFIPALSSLGIRFLDVSCARADYYVTSGRVVRMVRPMWAGTLMAGASLSAKQAENEISGGWLDLVTWGRQWIANADLLTRMSMGIPLVDFETSMLKCLH